MGCFLADRRSSIRAAISAGLCRAGCVEKPRQSPAMPAFFSLPARQIRRESDRVIELLRSVVARGAPSRLAYGAISNNALRKNQEVDGRRRFYEPLATNHEPLSFPARQIRRGSDRVIELLRSVVARGGTIPPCIWCHIEQRLTQKSCRGAHVGRPPLRATSHEPL